MLRKARDSDSLAIQETFPRLVSGGYAAPIPPLYGSLSDSLAYAADTFYIFILFFILYLLHITFYFLHFYAPAGRAQ